MPGSKNKEEISVIYHLAVIMPALGPKIGGVYLATFFLGGLCRILFVIVVGRLTLPPKTFFGAKQQEPAPKAIRLWDIVWDALKKIEGVIEFIADIGKLVGRETEADVPVFHPELFE